MEPAIKGYQGRLVSMVKTKKNKIKIKIKIKTTHKTVITLVAI